MRKFLFVLLLALPAFGFTTVEAPKNVVEVEVEVESKKANCLAYFYFNTNEQRVVLYNPCGCRKRITYIESYGNTWYRKTLVVNPGYYLIVGSSSWSYNVESWYCY